MARVLVIDDEPEVRSTIGLMLEAGEHTAVMAGSQRSLMADLEAGEYDLVITDLNMPGLTGWDIAAWVKQRRHATPVIAVGGATEGNGSRSMADFAAVLGKPFRRDVLLRAVAAAMPDCGAG